MIHMNDILVIDRDQWARGSEPGAYLLNETDGSMCCFGFDALQIGVPEGVVIGRRAPRDIRWHYPDAAAVRFGGPFCHSKLVEQAIEVNDDPEITDSERERKLTPLLKALGWKAVLFVGGETK